MKHVKYFEVEVKTSIDKQKETQKERSRNLGTLQTNCTYLCSHLVTKADSCQHGTCLSKSFSTKYYNIDKIAISESYPYIQDHAQSKKKSG